MNMTDTDPDHDERMIHGDRFAWRSHQEGRVMNINGYRTHTELMRIRREARTRYDARRKAHRGDQVVFIGAVLIGLFFMAVLA